MAPSHDTHSTLQVERPAESGYPSHLKLGDWHIQNLQVVSLGTRLNVIELGSAQAPRTVLFVHGLRDSAHALLPTVQTLLNAGGADAYRILLLELRGHGQSQRSQAYGMPNFILDVYNVQQQLIDGKFALFGHSLGGHIAAKYAALFAEQISALMLIEGLGPPTRAHEGDASKELAAYRHMLLTRFRLSSDRTLPSLDEVVDKLLKNNPRLDPAAARALAPHLTREQDGKLSWAFDSLASSVFVGTSAAENEKFWRHVEAPTLIVSGSLSYEYWGSELAEAGFSGKFAEGEMEARAAMFKHAQHHWFANSGHMVHYDEPERLGQLIADFLENNYE